MFCEKPLTVDFAAGRKAIARIEAERHRSAEFFARDLARTCGNASGRQGRLHRRAERVNQPQLTSGRAPGKSRGDRWLAERAEGGFSREVLSHFVFVLQRALGQATVEEARPDYPADGVGSERGLTARLVAGGVPVMIEAKVGGSLPDFNRMTLVGSAGAIEIHDWFGLRRRRNDGDWVAAGTAQSNRQIGQSAQLDQAVAMIEGRTHTLPSFAEALAVQETIEAILKGR